MRLILMRHPPVANSDICYGLSDVALAADWRTETETALQQLPSYDVAVSSPALRCRAVLQLLPAHARAADAAMATIDPRLRELSFGAWEGVPWAEIERTEISAWKTDLVHRAPPGGESLASLHTRAIAWLAETRAHHKNGRVLCITHLGVVRCLLAHALGISLMQSMQLPVDYLSAHTIDCAADGSFDFPLSEPLVRMARAGAVG